MAFDPSAAAEPGSGLFGLPFPPAEARLVVLPVPFDATTSYRDGARHGPAAVLEASRQVDLLDLDFGRTWEAGIAMLPLDDPLPRSVARWNRDARRAARPILDRGGRIEGDRRLERRLAEVNALGERLNDEVEARAEELLADGRVPVVLGGDHAVPFGAIRAYARRHPGLGILHVDAHADLRDAYEGFAWSHASIMHNVVRRIGARGGIAGLVQVGLRDIGEDELRLIEREPAAGDAKVSAFFDGRLQERRFAGETWRALCDEIVAALPGEVYVSLDVDGLDPALCPDTGTPVPGGLTFAELVELLRAVVRSGRRIVGGDLCEVAPSPRAARDEWGSDMNAIVGARVLYKLLGAIVASRAGAAAAGTPDAARGGRRRKTAGATGRSSGGRRSASRTRDR